MLPFDAFSAAAAAAESSNQSQTDRQTNLWQWQRESTTTQKDDSCLSNKKIVEKKWAINKQTDKHKHKHKHRQVIEQTLQLPKLSSFFFFFLSFSHHKRTVTFNSLFLSLSLSHFWCHHFYFFFLFTEHCCCLLCTAALFFFSWVDDLIFSFFSVVQSSPLTSLWPACVFYLTDGNAAGFLLKLSLSLSL